MNNFWLLATLVAFSFGAFAQDSELDNPQRAGTAPANIPGTVIIKVKASEIESEDAKVAVCHVTNVVNSKDEAEVKKSASNEKCFQELKSESVQGADGKATALKVDELDQYNSSASWYFYYYNYYYTYSYNYAWSYRPYYYTCGTPYYYNYYYQYNWNGYYYYYYRW